MVKIIGVSLDESNYEYNISYVKELLEDKTVYLVKDDIDELEGYEMRYVFSQEPTKKDTIQGSINGKFIRDCFTVFLNTLAKIIQTLISL